MTKTIIEFRRKNDGLVQLLIGLGLEQMKNDFTGKDGYAHIFYYGPLGRALGEHNSEEKTVVLIDSPKSESIAHEIALYLARCKTGSLRYNIT